MRGFTNHQRLWFYRTLSLLVTALVVHVAAVWAVPRAIMHVLMHGPTAQKMNMRNQAAFPEAVTAQSRTVVMPSPDMLYSVCAYDLDAGPVHVKAHPVLPNYWSIALYAANSDNFFVRNDRQSQGRPVDLWVVPPVTDGPQKPVPAGSEVVVSPSNTGFLLLRVLTTDYQAEKAVLEPARRTLQCSQG